MNKLDNKLVEIIWKTRAMYSISWGDSGNHKACDSETISQIKKTIYKAIMENKPKRNLQMGAMYNCAIEEYDKFINKLLK